MSRVCRVCCTILVVGSTDVSATTVREVPFDRMCERAERVFCGTVLASRAERDARTDAIHTFTTFGQLEWIAGGDDGDTYTLRTLGGEAEGEKLIVHGMPRFEIGVRYVLFVRGNRHYACPVVGWRQGCFHVVGGEDGRITKVRTADGRDVVGVRDGRLLTLRDDDLRRDSPAPYTLDQFIARIQAARGEPTSGNHDGVRP